MTAYPLIFSFRDIIAGKGFIANVTSTGRVLLVREDDDDWWLFGVQPGGIAGGHPDRNVALGEFKKNYLSVLYDIAVEAPTYDEFVAEVRKLFAVVNEPNEADWKQALELVRSGKVKFPGLIELEQAATHETKVEVALMTQGTATPAANPEVESDIQYAKAA